MICSGCGTANRDGARFCDSCGEPLDSAAPRRDAEAEGDDADDGQPLLGSGGLVGWMAVDWTLHFAAAAVVGILLGIAMVGLGYYSYSALFFLIGVVGILGTRYMLRART